MRRQCNMHRTMGIQMPTRGSDIVGRIGDILFAFILLASAPSCTPNPATGQQDFTLFMSESEEARIGAQEHSKIIVRYGGVYDDPKIGAYVAEIGGRLAANSEGAKTPFTFTVLNTPNVNAFALPGGYVYVTRGLIALANSEAELAGVVAHEIGHVIARHTAQRYSRAAATQIGATLLSALIGSREVGNLLQVGGQLYLLSFSRAQEFEADTLGIRYLNRTGYDPVAEAQFLQNLGREKELQDRLAQRDARDRESDFLTTHPNTPERVQRAIAAAGGGPSGRPLRRDIFLDRINGMLFGDDPEQGLVRGRRFMHPGLRFGFEVPPNFRLFNTSERVIALHPDKAAIVFDSAGPNTHPDVLTYLTQIWASGVALKGVERLMINGMAGATGQTTVDTQNGRANLRMIAIQFANGSIYRFRFLTPPALTDRLNADLRRTTFSFRTLSQSEASGLKPYRLQSITVGASDTINSLAARLPFADFQVERFRTLNGLGPSDRVRAGQRVKIVIETSRSNRS